MEYIKLKSVLQLNESDIPPETIAQIKQKCPMAVMQYSNGCSFFRGVRSNEAVIHHDPRGKFRKSSDSNNFSLLYSGINPDWAKIPSRYSSLVFTNDEEVAEGYGSSVYDVFVEGTDPIVAYGTNKDNYANYWAGFKAVGLRPSTELDTLDVQMERIFPIILADNRIKFFGMNDTSELQTLLDKLDSELAHMSEDDIRNTTFIQSQSINQECIDYVLIIKRFGIHTFLRTIFNPELNGICVCPLSQFPTRMSGVEVWTDRPAYLLNSKFNGVF